jgi:hypothetical protein
VDENVLSVFFFDESEPLFLVEPLDDSFRHTLLLPIILLTFHAPLKQKKAEPFLALLQKPVARMHREYGKSMDLTKQLHDKYQKYPPPST